MRGREAFRPRVAEYERKRLDEDGTSRLSPYLRFGCISPRMLLAELPPADELARQLCWRDFFAQLLRVHPLAQRGPPRPRRLGARPGRARALAQRRDRRARGRRSDATARRRAGCPTAPA